MKAYLGLGSNILPEANLTAAADLLREEWPDIRFSAVYRSKAMEHADQADFLNAAAVVDIDRDAESIHRKLKQIEEALSKDVAFRFGPRTIDIDLLLYGDTVMESAELTLPHPRMHQRRFVLEPLCELIDPKTRHPALGKTWKELLEATNDQQCERVKLKL